MGKPTIVCIGSCIINDIARGLNAIPGLGDHVEVHKSQTQYRVAGLDALSPDVLKRCRVLIEEAESWAGASIVSDQERALMPADVTTILIPALRFNSLWPLIGADPRNVPVPEAEFGMLPLALGDRLAIKIVEEVADPGARVAAYNAENPLDFVNVGRLHELDLLDMFKREQGADVKVAGFIASYFRDIRLYYTHVHPTGSLLSFVLSQIVMHPLMRELIPIGLAGMFAAIDHWRRTSGVFEGEDAPIHPKVAEYFGLKWYSPDLKYRWLECSYTFEEWIQFYLSYEPPAQTAV